jgi:hypothetical protein
MRQSWRSVVQDWELEIEWLRGRYVGTLRRNNRIEDQHADRDAWEVIHRLAYAAVIWPTRLN